MAETYCGKNCIECVQKESLNCQGCKTGPGRQFGGDCELAKCVRDKGHETCETCGFKGNCGTLRSRDNMPDYGSFNNYMYCEQHGMEKYMKFTMYEKETKDGKYRDNPYRACNFAIDHEGYMVCPNGKRFHFLRSAPVKGNRFGRTEEFYQCEDCSGCPHREKCHKSKDNRIVRINEELTKFHNEVLNNLNCVHGALLRMNRSIQAEGTFGGVVGLHFFHTKRLLHNK